MAGVTKTTNFDMQVRVADLISRFAKKYQILADLLGIMRPIEKEPGTELRGVTASVALESGIVAEGASIPKSVATVEETVYGKITIEKFAKAITMEAINKYGAEAAVEKTDEAFITELLNSIIVKFATFLKTGKLTSRQTTWKGAVAESKGLVTDLFQSKNLTLTEVVGFVNTRDAYNYLGTAELTTQNEFGIEYVKNFMGFRTLFLMPGTIIPRGKVFATPVENIIAYFVRPDHAAFRAAGIEFTVDKSPDGLPVLGIHANGNYDNFTGEMQAAMGLDVFAEFLDGIANVKVEASGSLGAITVTSAAGADTGDSKITISGYTPEDGEVYYYKEGSAALTPTYLEEMDMTGWTVIVPEEGGNNIEGLTASNVITVVSVNGSGQAVASGYATITVKTAG